MTKDETKQAIEGFTQFFRAITGNQELEIPNIKKVNDVEKEYYDWLSKKWEREQKLNRLLDHLTISDTEIINELFIPRTVIEDIKAEIQSKYDYQNGVISIESVLDIIDKHLGKEHE